MAQDEPGDSPVFLNKQAAAAEQWGATPQSNLSLSPTVSVPAVQSPQLGAAMAAARGKHAALEAMVEEQAAVVVQAHVRGRQTRQQMRLTPILPRQSSSPRWYPGGPSPIPPGSPGREARSVASEQLAEALASLSAAEARAEALSAQLSQAEGALAAQTSAQQGEASVRQETKASLQAALAERMAARAGGKGDLRLLRQTMSVWVAGVRERAVQQRATLEAGFAELERSVVAYRTESVGRADAAEERFSKMQARLKETEALLAASREAEALVQTELESVKGKAGQLGAAMQARVVAAEGETASCRAELQAAMREQEERSSARVSGLQAELEELRGEAAGEAAAFMKVQAEMQGLKGVEEALQEAVGRENELRARQAMLDSNQEERSRRTEAVRKAEKLEQQRSLAAQMSLESAVAERDEQLEKVSKEFESYMTARYLLTIRRMASCKASAAFNSWAGAVQRAKRARGTMSRAVTRLMQRILASAFGKWATLLSYERKHRRTKVKVSSHAIRRCL